MKIVTNYFEDRREALFEVIGPQMLADVIGYHAHRASIQHVLRAELERAADGARGRPVLPVALSLGGIALVDLLAAWPEAPVEACVTIGSQAPLLYTFDAIPAMPYDEADPPHLPVPWLNIYDTRDFLSFLAEPLFRRSDGLASVVDLRVRSGKDFPKSHSAYWELAPVWDAIATAFTWKRTEPLTVREARRLGFEARKAPTPRVDERSSRGAEEVDRGRRACPARRPPARQRWKSAAAASSTPTTTPRVVTACRAIRARGNLWTSKAHLLFGSPATCVRPVALRPRLATGLPLSIGLRQGRR